MTQEEVTNNFVYHKWYDKHHENIDFYTLSPEFTDMVRWGFGKIFTPSNTEDMIIPFSHIAFYCINKDGYLKVLSKIMEHIDNLSVNFLIDKIKKTCEEFNLKFVALPSKKYSWIEIEKLLGEDAKYELNEKGEIILYM